MIKDLIIEFVRKRQRRYLLIALSLFLFAIVIDSVVKPLQASYFPVRYVRVQGSFKHIEKSELQALIEAEVETGYWELDLRVIRSQAEQLAWIKHVQTRRVWPDTLVLTVEEHLPFVRFNENHLLSTEAVPYLPKNTQEFHNLPVVFGSIDQSTVLFDAFKEMQASIQNLGMGLVELQVTDRKSWSIQMSNGVLVELGREDPLQNFERFIVTLSLLGEQQIQSMVRVDLRYQNGYAVEWKPGTQPEWSSFVKRSDPKQGIPIQSI